jgi:hypothetical protein
MELITSSMIEPIAEGLKGVISVILPVGFGILGTMLGVRLIPRLFRMFL